MWKHKNLKVFEEFHLLCWISLPRIPVYAYFLEFTTITISCLDDCGYQIYWRKYSAIQPLFLYKLVVISRPRLTFWVYHPIEWLRTKLTWTLPRPMSTPLPGKKSKTTLEIFEFYSNLNRHFPKFRNFYIILPLAFMNMHPLIDLPTS